MVSIPYRNASLPFVVQSYYDWKRGARFILFDLCEQVLSVISCCGQPDGFIFAAADLILKVIDGIADHIFSIVYIYLDEIGINQDFQPESVSDFGGFGNQMCAFSIRGIDFCAVSDDPVSFSCDKFLNSIKLISLSFL